MAQHPAVAQEMEGSAVMSEPKLDTGESKD